MVNHKGKKGTSQQHINIIKAANYYATELGLAIIPLCSFNHKGESTYHNHRCQSPGKAPVLKSWTKQTSTTKTDLKDWFVDNSLRNIGLVLGKTEHYNMMGVDIDGELGRSLLKEEGEF